MDRLKILLITTILLLTFQQNAHTQNINNEYITNDIDSKISESIFITANTNTLITGETLRCKVFCLESTTQLPSVLSKIAYIELINSDHNSIYKHKISLQNGTGNDDFFIAQTLKTGHYKLIVYTNLILNKSNPKLFSMDIYIINPYENYKLKEKTNSYIPKEKVENYEIIPVSDNKNNIINLELEKNNYNKRDLVNLKINSKSDDEIAGEFLLSIRKVETLSSNKVPTLKNYKNSFFLASKDTEIVIPEIRGEIISGKITSDFKNNSLKDKNIALSIVGKNYNFKITKTDFNGRYIFNLEKLDFNDNIIIQMIDDNKTDYNVLIDEDTFLDNSNLIFDNFQINLEDLNTIKERAIASQIQNAYYNLTKDSIISVNNTPPFFSPSNKEYILDEYKRFPTFKETIIEIIDDAYFKEENGVYTLHVYDHLQNYQLSSPALILVDGLIIEDINELFKYKASNIYNFNIINGGYYYGTKTFNGLIAITTFKNNYKSDLKGKFIIKPEIMRSTVKLNYYQPNYLNNKNTRIPDYRYQLLWLPELKIVNNENIITFYTSDISGTFEIRLEGFTKNGTPVSITKNFEVTD